MIEGAPELHPVFEQYLQAFYRLSASRPTGMGPGRIAFEAIDRYAARYGFDGAAFEDLHLAVLALDEEFLDWHAARVKREAEQNKDA